MNTVPTTAAAAANAIESTKNNVSVLKMPSSGAPLLNIPPPIPLQWQLAVPSQFISTEMERSNSIIAPTEITVKKQHTSPPSVCVDDVHRILKQFGRLNDYDKASNILISAFIRDLQCQIPLIIPSEINELCSTFYYTKESKYIHFAYKLFIALKERNIDRNVSGKQLVSIINESQCVKSYKNIIQMCCALIEHNLLELSWYKTTFSSLFDEESTDKTLFKDSADYVYSLTDLMVQASGAHFSASQSHNCET